jgi:hypothetical protein
MQAFSFYITSQVVGSGLNSCLVYIMASSTCIDSLNSGIEERGWSASRRPFSTSFAEHELGTQIPQLIVEYLGILCPGCFALNKVIFYEFCGRLKRSIIECLFHFRTSNCIMLCKFDQNLTVTV